MTSHFKKPTSRRSVSLKYSLHYRTQTEYNTPKCPFTLRSTLFSPSKEVWLVLKYNTLKVFSFCFTFGRPIKCHNIIEQYLLYLLNLYGTEKGSGTIYAIHSVTGIHSLTHTADFIWKVPGVYTHSMETIYISQVHRVTCLFLKPGFCQGHSVNLRIKTRVLFFEETCFF